MLVNLSSYSSSEASILSTYLWPHKVDDSGYFLPYFHNPYQAKAFIKRYSNRISFLTKYFSDMKPKATKFNSEKIHTVLEISSRADKLGNIYFFVEYTNSKGDSVYHRFENMSSVLDFIHSNF